MRLDSWTVTEKDARPAGRPGECFYCKALVGQEHKKGCVCRRRTVVLKVEAELVVSVPEDWPQDLAGEPFSCQSTVLERLRETEQRMEAAEEGCMCGVIQTSFLREATGEDERSQCLRVSSLPA
jgi:hypothetical protein